MTDPIQQYANRFPHEISAAIEGLDNDRKRAIFVLLYDDPGLSFTEIQSELSDEKIFASETLSTCLEDLKSGALVNRRVRNDDDDSRFSTAYSVSKYGEQFFKALLGSLRLDETDFSSGVRKGSSSGSQEPEGQIIQTKPVDQPGYTSDRGTVVGGR